MILLIKFFGHPVHQLTLPSKRNSQKNTILLLPSRKLKLENGLKMTGISKSFSVFSRPKIYEAHLKFEQQQIKN